MEDSEKCDGKGVEVGGWRAALEVELATEELHAEKGEYEDEEEEQEQERYDAAHGVEQRDDEVAQRRPILGHLEDAQEAQGTQDGETERAGLHRGPYHLEYRARDHDAVEAIEGRLEVDARTEGVHLYHHFAHEEAQEHELGVVCKYEKTG